MSSSFDVPSLSRVCGSLFSGWFQERILNGDGIYRDRINIDKTETELLRNVKNIKRKIRRCLGLPSDEEEDSAEIYTGIKKSGSSFSLFCDLSTSESSPLPFGHFWFLVEEAKLDEKGRVKWKIKVIRSVLQGDLHSSSRCPHCGKLPVKEETSDEPLDLSEVATGLQRRFCDIVNPFEWLEEAKPYLTPRNLVNCLKFVVVLIMALFSGLANLLPTVLQLLNRTIQESSHFLRQATPFLIACIDMVNKAIGGFYLLLTMVWKDLRKPKSPAENQPTAAIEDRTSLRQRYEGGSRYPYRREAVQRPYLQ